MFRLFSDVQCDSHRWILKTKGCWCSWFILVFVGDSAIHPILVWKPCEYKFCWSNHVIPPVRRCSVVFATSDAALSLSLQSSHVYQRNLPHFCLENPMENPVPGVASVKPNLALRRLICGGSAPPASLMRWFLAPGRRKKTDPSRGMADGCSDWWFNMILPRKLWLNGISNGDTMRYNGRNFHWEWWHLWLLSLKLEQHFALC